jgi:hypothetical protein
MARHHTRPHSRLGWMQPATRGRAVRYRPVDGSAPRSAGSPPSTATPNPRLQFRLGKVREQRHIRNAGRIVGRAQGAENVNAFVVAGSQPVR